MGRRLTDQLTGTMLNVISETGSSVTKAQMHRGKSGILKGSQG